MLRRERRFHWRLHRPDHRPGCPPPRWRTLACPRRGDRAHLELQLHRVRHHLSRVPRSRGDTGDVLGTDEDFVHTSRQSSSQSASSSCAWPKSMITSSYKNLMAQKGLRQHSTLLRGSGHFGRTGQRTAEVYSSLSARPFWRNSRKFVEMIGTRLSRGVSPPSPCRDHRAHSIWALSTFRLGITARSEHQ